MFRVGDSVRDYRIHARLKSGGMATLFLARRTGAAGFARDVAIKVVHPHLAEDPDFVQMFVEEALLSVQIQHPNVVHVEELGEAAGAHFLVMEYVRGCSLAQVLRACAERERRLPLETAVAIAIQIADGLHAAHETVGPDGRLLGVVHRDVSPQNVLLGERGQIKLIDFGIAKALGRAKHTETGSIKGKPRYMPPEQAFGEAVDRRTDVYALGIVLWEMLTGRSLFHGDDAQLVIRQARDPDVPPPGSVVDGVPPALDATVMAALAPYPSDRLASARELRRRLAEAVPSAVLLDAAQVVASVEALLGCSLRALAGDAVAAAEPVDATAVSPLAATPDEPSQSGVTDAQARPGAYRGRVWAALAGMGGAVVIGVGLWFARAHRTEISAPLAVAPRAPSPPAPAAAASVTSTGPVPAPPAPAATASAASSEAPSPPVSSPRRRARTRTRRARAQRATRAVAHGRAGISIVDDGF